MFVVSCQSYPRPSVSSSDTSEPSTYRSLLVVPLTRDIERCLVCLPSRSSALSQSSSIDLTSRCYPTCLSIPHHLVQKAERRAGRQRRSHLPAYLMFLNQCAIGSMSSECD